MNKQNRRKSLIEAVTNTFVGFGISLLSLFVLFPIIGIDSTPVKNVPKLNAVGDLKDGIINLK